MVFLAEDGESDEQVVLVSQSGTVNRIKVRDVSIQSRRARYCLYFPQFASLFMSQQIVFWLNVFLRGVILMRLDHSGKIQSASLISAADVEEDGEGIPSLEEAASV